MRTAVFRVLHVAYFVCVEDDDEVIPAAPAGKESPAASATRAAKLAEFDEDEFIGVEELQAKQNKEAVLKNLANPAKGARTSLPAL